MAPAYAVARTSKGRSTGALSDIGDLLPQVAEAATLGRPMQPVTQLPLPPPPDPKTLEEPEALGDAESEPIEAKFPLEIRKAEYSIFELHRRWKNRVLHLHPDFQRDFVWPIDKQIKLVESVMARIPLPVFYLSDDEDGIEVVDGQQRLTTLFAFMEGRFADRDADTVIRHRDMEVGQGRPFELRKLRLLQELEGMTFEKLDPKLRRKFEETQLTCFVLDPRTSPKAKFELFERINEGATPLNPQEIRNALHRGPGLELVRRLAGPGSRFRAVAGEHRVYKRMRADELVLRGIAFSWRGWDQYKGDLKDFLNTTLSKLNETTPAERAVAEATFSHGIAFAERVFGDKAWQRYDPTTKAWSGHISGPLVEVVSTSAHRVFPSELPSPSQASAILRGFKELCGDYAFNNAILTATQTVANVKVRMVKFEEVCRNAR